MFHNQLCHNLNKKQKNSSKFNIMEQREYQCRILWTSDPSKNAFLFSYTKERFEKTSVVRTCCVCIIQVNTLKMKKLKLKSNPGISNLIWTQAETISVVKHFLDSRKQTIYNSK